MVEGRARDRAAGRWRRGRHRPGRPLRLEVEASVQARIHDAHDQGRAAAGPRGRGERGAGRDRPLALLRGRRRHRGRVRVERAHHPRLDEPPRSHRPSGLRDQPRLRDAERRQGDREAARRAATRARLATIAGAGTLKGRVPTRASQQTRRFNGGMPMNLKPLGDRLIVQASEEDETTASGIVLPDTAKEKPQKGKVLAVGDGAIQEDGSRRPLDVSEGDEVLYSKYGGTEITVDGDELLVLRESDVLAKVG